MYRIQFQRKNRISKKEDVLYSLYAILIALFLGGIFIVFNKSNPFLAYKNILKATLGSPYGLSETLVKTIPLIFTGLSVGIALKSRIWNIGAEGQLYFGALFGTAVALYFPEMPKIISISFVFATGFMGGAIFALIPAILKIKLKINEVITTLLLNYVAINVVDFFIYGAWKGPDNFPYTKEFPNCFQLWQLDFGRLHFGLFFALLCVATIYVLLNHTKFGYKIRITGSSRKAAKYAGIKVNKIFFLVFLISGGLAGLAGVSEICGIQHKLHHAISSEYGYTGIIVAWLARSNPFIIVLFSFFLSIIFIGTESLQISIGLPASIGKIIQSLLLFAILGSELFKNYTIKLINEKE